MNAGHEQIREGVTIARAALEQRLAQGGKCTIPVAGWSMLPLMPRGARIVVEAPGDLRAGDVIVYFLNDTMVVHRIVRVSRGSAGRRLTIKGDSALAFDPPIETESDIVGKVVSVVWGGAEVGMGTGFWRLAGRVIAGASLLVGFMLAHLVTKRTGKCGS